MATKTWTGSISTDWNTAGNWSPAGVPASGDDVVIGTTATSPALGAGTTVNTITINGSNTLALSGAATVLTVMNGVTLSSTGGISGFGTLAAAVTASAAAHLTAAGGTLEITGAITDSGSALVLTIVGATDSLLLDAASAAHTVTFGSSGTLEINTSATLTIGTAMAVGAGTLQLNALSTLTDASGVTISTGTIKGAGKLAAAVTASGAAHITATSGTLEITGQITDSGSALTLTITGATDRLLLDSTSFIGSAAHTVTFGSSGTLELNSSASLTVGTAMAIGAGTLKLDSIGPPATLTDASGVTISTGTISGTGILAATVTATGAATIAVAGTVALEVTGSIIDSGNALALSFGSLILDSASAAHTVTFTGNNGVLLLRTNGTLTVGTAMTIGNGATLDLSGAGSTLNDASGVILAGGMFGNGLITGQGTVNAGLSGTGTVTASGGTLHLTGAVASGPTLAIDASRAGSVLSIENTAIAAAPIAINNANQTLAVGASGNLTINGGAESITNGTIKLSTAGQLSDSAGFTIGGGALLIGAGKATGAIGGSGIVEASGGMLELVNAIAASDGTSFEIANSTIASLLLDGAPGTGNTFTFLGARGDFALASDTGFNDTISGLNVGTGGAKTNFVDIEGHTVTVSSVTGQGTTSGTVTLSDGAVLNLTNLSSTAWFANVVGDGASGTDVFVSDTACFCRGTMILTEAGEAAVEDLAIGDRVTTLSGEAKPIRWIGRRVVAARFADPLRALPIRIKTGALDDGVPSRDLYLSPDHALLVEGVLIQAGALVNGSSIVRERNVPKTFTYYHVELADHDLISAENTSAETFVDNVDRMGFDNWDEHQALYGDTEIIVEMAYPRAKAHRQVPMATRARLAARAAHLYPSTAAA